MLTESLKEIICAILLKRDEHEELVVLPLLLIQRRLFRALQQLDLRLPDQLRNRVGVLKETRFRVHEIHLVQSDVEMRVVVEGDTAQLLENRPVHDSQRRRCIDQL